MKETVLIYHGSCPDGFMGATIFCKAAGNEVENIEFHAGVHQEAPPDATGKKVVFVDFSYKRPVILEMAQNAKSILLVDHHASALADLVDLPANVQTILIWTEAAAAWLQDPPTTKISRWRKQIQGLGLVCILCLLLETMLSVVAELPRVRQPNKS